ncbi:MAG: nucleotide exchange factor GrpE [Planctomycetes bacterium]|nr:nucleotide exchange factor GrpE [Planctomycetota bacterium]
MKQRNDKSKPGKKSDKDVAKAHEQLEQDFDVLQAEKLELFEKLQRVSADYANFQKRIPKQISDSVSYEKERLLKSLLPVLDNFEHTISSDHSGDIDAVMKGIKIVRDQMLDTFKSHGVEQIHAESQIFDPSQHEAMLQRTEEDKENNLILEEFQKGYTLNGRVIRPSKVIVNKSARETEVQPSPGAEPDTDPEAVPGVKTPDDAE